MTLWQQKTWELIVALNDQDSTRQQIRKLRREIKAIIKNTNDVHKRRYWTGYLRELLSRKRKNGDQVELAQDNFPPLRGRYSDLFQDVEVPCTRMSLLPVIHERFISPYYKAINSFKVDAIRDRLKVDYPDIAVQIVGEMLAEHDWRSRQTAAFFIALKGYTEFEDQIGRLLLRCDSSHAGNHYSVALASFNTEVGIGYFSRFLGSYLARSDLYVQQGSVIGAVAYLDSINDTNMLADYISQWSEFTQARKELSTSATLPEYIDELSLEYQISRFSERMQIFRDTKSFMTKKVSEKPMDETQSG